MAGVVARRITGPDGKPMGMRNTNPLLDTRQYKVEFPDGTSAAFPANVIAKNIYANIDAKGRTYAILQEISDHRTNRHAVKKDNGFFITPTGTRWHQVTTKGWDLLVTWEDGSTTWVPLKDLRESNPVEVAEYAVYLQPVYHRASSSSCSRRTNGRCCCPSNHWTRRQTYGNAKY